MIFPFSFSFFPFFPFSPFSIFFPNVCTAARRFLWCVWALAESIRRIPKFNPSVFFCKSKRGTRICVTAPEQGGLGKKKQHGVIA